MVAFEVAPTSGGKARVFDATSLPAWSPDNQRLAYTRAGGIYIAGIRTGRVRRLTRKTGLELTWSPDSRSLAFREGWAGPTRDTIYTSVSGDLLTVTLTGRVRTIVDSERAYGGRIISLAWAHPTKGVRYRAPEPAPPTRIAPSSLLAGGPISRLAADGPRVAFVSCEGVFAWTPATGEVMTLRDSDPLSFCRLRDRYWVGYSLALAGERLVYGVLEGCHSITVTLRLEVLAPARKGSSVARGRGACGSSYGPGVAGQQAPASSSSSARGVRTVPRADAARPGSSRESRRSTGSGARAAPAPRSHRAPAR
jgi:hypothetical protein